MHFLLRVRKALLFAIQCLEKLQVKDAKDAVPHLECLARMLQDTQFRISVEEKTNTYVDDLELLDEEEATRLAKVRRLSYKRQKESEVPVFLKASPPLPLKHSTVPAFVAPPPPPPSHSTAPA